MSRLLIADDHAVVRAGYRQFLEAEPGITEIGEAATGQAALDMLGQSEWQLLLLDIHMPDRDGIAVLRVVVAEHPQVRVLIMSGLPENQYARIVLRAGASGYLSKTVDPQELLKAVRALMAGRRYVSATLAQSMADDLQFSRDPSRPLHERLSGRELQIFLKIAGGLGISSIAEELTLSVKTVSTYRSRILEKMSFASNADIVGYALRNALLP
jgi:two-component system, NarL family, invasion response regulator UvrY